MQAYRNVPVYGTGEIEIAADPETVWGVLADIGGWPSWNPDITQVNLRGPVQPGTTFSWKSGPGTITSTFQVVDEPTELTWTGKTMGIPAVHAYRLPPAPSIPGTRSSRPTSPGVGCWRGCCASGSLKS